MAPKTAAELALAKKFELLRQKKAAAQAQQQQKDGGATKAPVTHASQASEDGASKAGAAKPAKQSKYTPITFTSKPALQTSKPLTAHEKALQALKAAREGGTARAGIGRLPQKRAPSGTAAGPLLNQQRTQDSSAAPAAAAAADASAAPPHRLPSQPKQQSARRSANHPAIERTPGHTEGPQQKRQRTEIAPEPPNGSTEQDATLFVGDLPQGCGHYELQEVFSQLANVVTIRMLEHKGIAFVTVDSEAEVGHIIDVADSAGLQIHGQIIRVARAHQPSDGLGPLDAPGAEPLKVQEVRMAARALAEQVDVSMPDIELQPPPERGLVYYDDL